jgi:hypothetical protein
MRRLRDAAPVVVIEPPTPGPEPDEVDFTGEDIGPSEPPTLTLGDTIEGHRETTRRWLALILVIVFASAVLFSLASVVLGAPVDDVKSVLEVLIPPLVALTGSVVGFYFGVVSG